jgi:catechol 2,3-dioxygenase-like lactoylglutathione lyase family enzyme
MVKRYSGSIFETRHFRGETSMLDHIGFSVTDMAKAKAFYDKALAPLGVSLIHTVPPEYTGGRAVHGYGEGQKPYFWIEEGKAGQPKLHVAFLAKDRAAVRAFYEAAMKAGGRDNGGPGLRPHYHPDYYGAFVLDPEGHNIEAVCHKPE